MLIFVQYKALWVFKSLNIEYAECQVRVFLISKHKLMTVASILYYRISPKNPKLCVHWTDCVSPVRPGKSVPRERPGKRLRSAWRTCASPLWWILSLRRRTTIMSPYWWKGRWTRRMSQSQRTWNRKKMKVRESYTIRSVSSKKHIIVSSIAFWQKIKNENPCVETVILKVMETEGGELGAWLCHEGRA